MNVASKFLQRALSFLAWRNKSQQQLSPDELRSVVHDSSARIPPKRHGMLLNILDLEKATVNDILVPRNDVIGLDIDDELDEILDQIGSSQHTLMPIYRKDLDNIVGMLHLRSVGRLLKLEHVNKASILRETSEPYYIPESTPLHTQLFNFQNKKMRIAFVVDEFGAVQGLVTLEDILEEIVGEFTTDMADANKDISAQTDGSFLIDGGTSIREINRVLNWELDGAGAKTLNGLLTDKLQSIPDTSVGIDLDGYYAEIIQTKDNVIRTVKMRASAALSAKGPAEN